MEHCHLHMKIWVILNGMGNDDKQEISKTGVSVCESRCCVPLQIPNPYSHTQN